MIRKECDSVTSQACTAILAVCCALCTCARTDATETIYLSRSVAVTGDQITLGHICHFSQSDSIARRPLESAIVKSAPNNGESLFVTTADVRRTLQRNGVNLANVLLTGATKCEVSRSLDAAANPAYGRQGAGNLNGAPSTTSTVHADEIAETVLLDRVRRAFAERLMRYGGKAEIRIGLSGKKGFVPPQEEYTIAIRVRGDRWTGRMIRAQVDVFVGAEKVRTVPVVVSATITKEVVVARRTINQKSKIREEDLDTAERTYDDPAAIPTATMDAVVGRQAKRFIRVGQSLRLADLETVPVIKRGEIVDVFSLAAGVEVRSVGKAMGNGGIGDVIEIQTGARRRDRLSAVVTGVRQVSITGAVVGYQDPRVRLAFGGTDEH